eukprot:scaffold71180_cov60-Phaeocystis_antarctica.AAC.1
MAAVVCGAGELDGEGTELEGEGSSCQRTLRFVAVVLEEEAGNPARLRTAAAGSTGSAGRGTDLVLISRSSRSETLEVPASEAAAPVVRCIGAGAASTGAAATAKPERLAVAVRRVRALEPSQLCRPRGGCGGCEGGRAHAPVPRPLGTIGRLAVGGASARGVRLAVVATIGKVVRRTTLRGVELGGSAHEARLHLDRQPHGRCGQMHLRQVSLVVEALLLARERGDAHVELLDPPLGVSEGRAPLEHDIGTSEVHPYEEGADEDDDADDRTVIEADLGAAGGLPRQAEGHHEVACHLRQQERHGREHDREEDVARPDDEVEDGQGLQRELLAWALAAVPREHRLARRQEGEGHAAHREERYEHEERAVPQLARPAVVGHAVYGDLRRDEAELDGERQRAEAGHARVVHDDEHEEHRDGEGDADAPLAARAVHAVAEVGLVALAPERDVVVAEGRRRAAPAERPERELGVPEALDAARGVVPPVRPGLTPARRPPPRPSSPRRACCRWSCRPTHCPEERGPPLPPARGLARGRPGRPPRGWRCRGSPRGRPPACAALCARRLPVPVWSETCPAPNVAAPGWG